MPLPDGLLERYKGDAEIFVETGTHRGDGVMQALEAGFDSIYSTDVSEFCFGWCSHRFREIRTVVHLHLGDSRPFLERILDRVVKSPAVFWLDAHWCGGDGELDGRDAHLAVQVPLLEELSILRSHHIKTHTILVDDVRLFGAPLFPSRDEVVRALKSVNPKYRFSWEDSRDFPQDILVASV